METVERVTYRVVPGEPSGWNVMQENSGQVFGNYQSRTQAILQGVDLARGHSYSLLVVHGKDGKAEKEYNYGRKPRVAPLL
jgi:hypothetical protein